ncbi:DUF4157 domain-containing protein [Roseivirga sp. BDSF3-8]|uniref:eCIS core domain-containing protein n=1 Tax=Roseivirga sp. BDSF3-8 TaxID=3241598 RepID=UPI00353193D5
MKEKATSSPTNTRQNQSQSGARVPAQRKAEGSGTQKKGLHFSEVQTTAATDNTAQLQAIADTFGPKGPLPLPPDAPVQRQENKTGLPDQLKSGIEHLSGYSMDDVKVHYNSSRPAQLQAHAYAQGTDIHMAPGQEQHLPHEAWHVVQQKQGRVQPTKQLKGQTPVNDDTGLEREADVMGAKALTAGNSEAKPLQRKGTGGEVVQKRVYQNSNKKYYSDLDPSLEFDKLEDAMAYERSIEPPDPISGGRPPTLYTYTSTKSTNKMSGRGIPQGPHTVGHSALLKALNESEGKIDIRHVMKEQIMTPDQWRNAVNSEMGGGDQFHGKTEFSLRLLRAYKAYAGLFNGLLKSLTDSSEGDPLDFMHELINLSPYATYGWTNPDKITRKHLKGKGETSDLADTDRNIDPHSRKKFKDKGMYDEMVEDRLDLLDDDFIMEELSSGESEDEYIDEEEKMDDSSVSKEPEIKTSMRSQRVAKKYLEEIKGTSRLFANNCLINAIAGSAGVSVSLPQLLEIRIRLGSIGNMLVASPQTVGVILNVLGINAGVVIHYHINNQLPNEIIGNQNGTVLHIYHTGHAHFVHNCPNVLHYF